MLAKMTALHAALAAATGYLSLCIVRQRMSPKELARLKAEIEGALREFAA